MRVAPSVPARLVMVLLLPVGLQGSARAAEEPFPKGTIVERVACQSDPSQTYSLYLPSSYTADRRWPLLLVFDPRGRGKVAAEIFRPAAERYGWILMSSNDTQSDGGGERNQRALRAMWADLGPRFALDPKRVYAAGFSGTAAVAWELGLATGELAGVVIVGGIRWPDLHDRAITFAVFGAAGRHDFNFNHMKGVDELVAGHQSLHRLEHFDGDHEWLPGALAEEAVAWFEVLAMRDGRRTRDEAFVKARLQADLQGAERLEAEGRLVEARRHYQALVRTFDGLIDVEPARARLAALAGRAALADALKDERRWDEWETRTRTGLAQALAEITDSETPPMLADAENRLRLRQLRSQGGKRTYEGDAANRTLNWLFAEVSFYVWRDLLEKGSFTRAAYLQQIATRFDEKLPLPWMRLALTYARAGDAKRALDALEDAVERGWSSLEPFDTVDAFAPLRDDPAFRRLRAQVAARAPGP